MSYIPNPDDVFPNDYGTSCFIKNVISAPNIIVGDYTYYDDPEDPTGFERNNVLFNYPEFGDKLIIGKFCAIAAGTKFIMGPANHRVSSVTTYPFHVFGGIWTERTPPHMSQLPFKGDIVIGNEELVELLLQWKWWDKPPEMLADLLPLLCDPDLEKVRKAIQKDTATPATEAGESSSG